MLKRCTTTNFKIEDEREEDRHQHLNHEQFVALIKTTEPTAGISVAILEVINSDHLGFTINYMTKQNNDQLVHYHADIEYHVIVQSHDSSYIKVHLMPQSILGVLSCI